MQLLVGSIKRYEWGSVDAIPQFLGIPADGEPLAEYWLGAHPLGPALLDGVPLDQVITKYPDIIGQAARREFDGHLPFMVKLLSAARPLSLQAHPNHADARAGFERENREQRPLAAADRTYRDPWAKTEIVIAVSKFETLVGFRDPRRSADLFSRLGIGPRTELIFAPLRHRQGSAGLAEVFLDCLVLDEDRRGAVTDVVTSAVRHLDAPGELGVFARDAVMLDEHFPGDPSLLAALLLNRRTLQPGEALHVTPGTLHAHLQGTAVEVMSNSDNVLRGGLTRKHIDVTALVQVVNFNPQEMSPIHPHEQAPGLWRYPVQERTFSVWRLDPIPAHAIQLPADGSGRILLVTEGEIRLSSGSDDLVLARGQSVFIRAGESVQACGDGRGFLTATGLDT